MKEPIRNAPSPPPSRGDKQMRHSPEEEDWDVELETTMRKSIASSEDIASGDEYERDLKAEMEAFDLDGIWKGTRVKIFYLKFLRIILLLSLFIMWHG